MKKEPKPDTQNGRLLALLKAEYPGEVHWLAAYAGGCGHAINSRADDLRHDYGYDVRCRVATMPSGTRHSYYRLEWLEPIKRCSDMPTGQREGWAK